MTIRRKVYQINDQRIAAPDEARWEPVVLGTTHTNLEIRSPYWRLILRKNISTSAGMETWLQHDNTKLDSITVPSHDDPRTPKRYTEATCLSVEKRYMRGQPRNITATFVVNTES